MFDRSPEGKEGPWVTYARMETLRSPKQLAGPAFGLGALTFQAWLRVQFGAIAWDQLYRIPRPMWMDYLRWCRRVLDIPAENGVSVDRTLPESDLLRLQLSFGPVCGNADVSSVIEIFMGVRTGMFLRRN